MIRLAWRSLLARKLRTILTALAILLGVAMISGTYVLTDQIDRGFTEIFDQAYQGTDVTITRKVSFSGGQMATALEGMPESLLDEVRAVDGVAEAQGYVSGSGAVAVDGELVQTGGAPTLFFGGPPSDLSATVYSKGAFPARRGEVGIIEKLAEDEGLDVGSTLTVITDSGPHEVRVSGVFSFGAAGSLGGSLLLNTTLEDAQEWFDADGRLSEIDVKATAGVPAATLRERIAAVLPDDVDVKTGEQAAADQTKQISDAIGQFLTPVLLSFGGVAVLVGAFIILNAFSMTVAQRRREFAMLRALGASRRQVLLSVTGEALVMGVFASVAGLFAGLAVASGVNQVFVLAGVDIPRSGLVMEPRTVVVALAVGIVVTVLSAAAPAWRATRVPPVAALQEGAALPAGRLAKYTPYLAAAVAALGVLGILGGMYGGGGTTTRLAQIAAGAVLVFVAVAMLSRFFVRPVARVIGWPLQRLSPISGRLARDNAGRNPARTAATASALMIGLGVVVFVAVFAQGLKNSFIDGFDRTVRADFLIATENFMPLPGDTLRRVQTVPAVDVAAALNGQQAQAQGKQLVPVYGVDPSTFARLWRFDWTGDESDGLLDELGATGAAVEEQTAQSLGIEVGDRFTVLSVEGKRAELEMMGEYRDPMMLNGVTLSDEGYATLFPKPAPFFVVAKRWPNVSEQDAKAQLEQALEDSPTAVVDTAAEYKERVVGQVNQLLNLMYGLLAMSVIISLFGIVNTLVLSVYERTREIGMVRAIGMSRGQVRATVRYESVITSVIGALMGIAVGVAFAWVITTRFAEQGITFSVPGVQLLVFLVVAVIVGVIAAILPARRAARIEILEAIHYE